MLGDQHKIELVVRFRGISVVISLSKYLVVTILKLSCSINLILKKNMIPELKIS